MWPSPCAVGLSKPEYIIVCGPKNDACWIGEWNRHCIRVSGSSLCLFEVQTALFDSTMLLVLAAAHGFN